MENDLKRIEHAAYDLFDFVNGKWVVGYSFIEAMSEYLEGWECSPGQFSKACYKGILRRLKQDKKNIINDIEKEIEPYYEEKINEL